MNVWSRGRVLVTGGAGFIGSALIWALNRRGCDRIILVDRRDSTRKWRNLPPLRYEQYIDADLLPARMESLQDISLVLHMGACSSTTENDMEYLRRNNVEYTKTLSDWAVARGIRFVYASSAATYGAREGRLSEDIPLSQLQPLNKYGLSKHLFDLYAQERGYLDRITGLKYFNVYGPNEQHKGDMRSMVDKAYAQVKATGRVRLFRSHRNNYADGEQRRDFIYIRDAVDMTLHVAERPAYGLINIGSGASHTWLELARAVFAALDREPVIEFFDMPQAIRNQYQYDTCAVLDRLRATGYNQDVVPLADAVREYVCSYLVPDRRLGDPSTSSPHRG